MRRQVMKPFRAPRQVIKETQEVEIEHVGRDMESQREQPHHEGVHCDGEQWRIEARKEHAVSVECEKDAQVLSQVPSPSLSNFDAYL